MNRTFDPAFMNVVITSPSVRDGAEASITFDLSEIINNMDNVVLQNDHGGFVIIKKAPGTYEWHTAFLPSGRGEQVREACKEALRYMFINTDCVRVITKARTSPAIKLAGEFMKERGSNLGYKYFSLLYEDWINTDEVVKKEGEIFHEMVEGKTNHDHDEVHDINVGAACLMVKSGNIDKLYLYNEWAMMSGYEPVFIVKKLPLILKVGNMMLEFNGELKCL
jgi:hypothetical protein